MNKRPEEVPGTRLCLCLTRDGLTAYGNREAFSALGEYMRWLEQSEPTEHFELHVTMSLESDKSKFDGLRPRNVWVLLEKEVQGGFPKKTEEYPGFELTFMRVTTEDLDEMAEFQDTETLPDDWNRES